MYKFPSLLTVPEDFQTREISIVVTRYTRFLRPQITATVMDTENTRSGKAEERILGDKATGEIDADPDHLANVQRGLKA